MIKDLILLPKKLLIWLISLYRNLLSPICLHTCRFYPSCSEYSIEALNKHGVMLGLGKAILRILRCGPFSKGGYDPV